MHDWDHDGDIDSFDSTMDLMVLEDEDEYRANRRKKSGDEIGVTAILYFIVFYALLEIMPQLLFEGISFSLISLLAAYFLAKGVYKNFKFIEVIYCTIYLGFHALLFAFSGACVYVIGTKILPFDTIKTNMVKSAFSTALQITGQEKVTGPMLDTIMSLSHVIPFVLWLIGTLLLARFLWRKLRAYLNRVDTQKNQKDAKNTVK